MVLVHGIGPNSPGKTLSRWSPEIEYAIARLTSSEALTVTQGSLMDKGRSVPTRELEVMYGTEEERRVLVTEACWSDAYAPRRLIGTAPWLTRIAPALVLPFLPDSRDSASLRNPSALSLVPMGLRFLARLTIIPIAAILVSLLPSVVQAGLVAALLSALGVTLVSRRANLAGHVRMAATDGADLQAVEARIGDVIGIAEEAARHVIVVAHSQGGFLSHRVLLGLRARVRLICVGSGLKPITLLRTLGGAPYNWASVVILVGVLAMSIGLSTHLQQGSVFPESLRTSTLAALAASTYGVAPLPASGAWKPSSIMEFLPSFQFTWLLFLELLVYAVAVFLVRRYGPTFLSSTRIASPPTVQDWLELTTRHDLVGRLTVPVLPPQAVEKAVVVAGNPLLDHIGYFRRGGVTVWIIASHILADLGLPASESVEKARQVSVARSERRHWLGIATLAIPLLVVATVGASMDASWRPTALVPILPWIVGIGVIAMLAVVLAEGRDSRQIAGRLPAVDLSVPWALPVASRIMRTAFLVVAAVLNLSVAAILQYPIVPGSSELASNHVFWAIIQCALAICLVAGYRPRPMLCVLLAFPLVFGIDGLVAWNDGPGQVLDGVVIPGIVPWVGSLLLTAIALLGRGWLRGPLDRRCARVGKGSVAD